jgi:hypothetical protein
MPPGYSVDHATVHLARRIPGVHIRAVRTTYQNDLPAAYLAGLKAKDSLQHYRVWAKDPRRCIYVLRFHGRVVGYAEAGTLADPAEALLINEYLLQEHRDNNLGSCLLLPVVACLLGKGVVHMGAGVANSNARMRHVAVHKWHGQQLGPVNLQMGPHDVPGTEYVWALAALRNRLIDLCA